MEIILRKKGNSLIPVDELGCEVLAKIKEGRDVGCDVIQRRNPRHHRLYWAMLKLLSEHTDIFAGQDTEIISIALKLATGLVKAFVDQETGKMVMVPLSISFAAMDQAKFNQFFDAACKTIAERWLPPGTTSEDVRRELIRMVDGEHALEQRVA